MKPMACLWLSAALLAQSPDLGSKAVAKAGADRAIEFFVATQHPTGTWGAASCDSLFDSGFSPATYYSWQVGAHAIVVMALLRAEETPERRACLDMAVHWLLSTRMPLRGSDWDNDAVWAWLYGTTATVALAQDKRFMDDRWQAPLVQRGKEFVSWLEKNQVPEGGFGYYDDPTFSRRPKWATSFATSSVLPALFTAMQFGWTQDEAMLRRAARYIKRCRLPNGAYEYDLNPIPRLRGGEEINNIKGSLGRIQVCNWALRLAGDADTTVERVRTGVQQFFQHHEFLAIARMRPIPHEAYYQNAGYFFYFGHYYCSQTINLLPDGEREAFHRQLRAAILKTQRADGSFCDFQGTGYMTMSSTAFAALALMAGL